MLHKPILTADEAAALIPSGSTLLLGGFGLTGNPINVIHALCERDVDSLTVVTNNLGEPGFAAGRLLERGRVSGAIGSYFTSNRVAVQRWLDGQLDVKLLPQGSLVEAIRAGGYGIGGFYTPTGLDTEITADDETKVIDGQRYVFVPAIRGDFAIVRAARADRAGNLHYARTDQNYNPVMATAGAIVIAEVAEIVDIGEIPPNDVHTPGVFVDYLVQADLRSEDLGSSASVDPPGEVDEARMAIARRTLAELAPGNVVNLGIGIPTLIAELVTDEHGLILHTENGMLGVGPAPLQGGALEYPVNAAKQPVTARPGASYFNSADSFGLIRGGHLDVAVLGALQVDAQGSLANWAVPGKPVLGVGGAMDLAGGARRLIVTMSHATHRGESKLVPELSLPATVRHRVDTLITELGVFRFPEGRLTLTELLGANSVEEVRQRTTAQFETSLR